MFPVIFSWHSTIRSPPFPTAIRTMLKIPSAQEVLQCTVHVKMHPRPRSLTESREVLRALEQFGPVASYWHLKV